MSKDVLAENCEGINISQLEKQVAELVPPRQSMSIAMLLNHSNEDDWLEEEEDNINVLQSASVEEGDGSCSGDDDYTGGLPSSKEQLFALAVMKQIAEACGVNNAAFYLQ